MAGPIFNFILSLILAFFHMSCRMYLSSMSHVIISPSDGSDNAIAKVVQPVNVPISTKTKAKLYRVFTLSKQTKELESYYIVYIS